MTGIAKRVVSVREFAEAVGTGERRIRDYVREGLVRAIRHGRRIVIPETEVNRFLEAPPASDKAN